MFGMNVGPMVMLIIWAFLLIAAIMAVFIPFWVLRIRNEVVSMNHKLSKMVDLLDADRSTRLESGVMIEDGKFKLCPECGARNRLQDTKCYSCAQAM